MALDDKLDQIRMAVGSAHPGVRTVGLNPDEGCDPAGYCSARVAIAVAARIVEVEVLDFDLLDLHRLASKEGEMVRSGSSSSRSRGDIGPGSRLNETVLTSGVVGPGK